MPMRQFSSDKYLAFNWKPRSQLKWCKLVEQGLGCGLRGYAVILTDGCAKCCIGDHRMPHGSSLPTSVPCTKYL
eukprot:1155569-Pelagomonas_calceolata.AAC.2